MLKTRSYSVAGTFYPVDDDQLRGEVQKLLKEGKQEIENKTVPNKTPKAIIVPHAGYSYSGKVAGAAYACLQGQKYDEVFLMGSSHNYSLEGVAIADFKEWETPLGTIPQSRRVDKIAESDDREIADLFYMDNAPHEVEHSLEVQLPFLQVVLKDSDIHIVPALVGKGSPRLMAKTFDSLLHEDDLFVVSTDFSHYYNYDTAVEKDRAAINAIKKLNTEEFLDGKCEACGGMAVAALLELAKLRDWNPYLILHQNSGDITEKKDKVVGYASFIFY